MPVVLQPDEYDQWLNGSFDHALRFHDRYYPDDPIEMMRTSELWVKRR